jgi:hypothetical protein
MGQQGSVCPTEEAKTATGAVNSLWPGRRSTGLTHLHLRRHYGWRIEQTFKDVKEVWGAGQQQVRNIHATIGAWHMNLWAYTMVELWAWEKPEEELVDRSRSPWDGEPRRPSHADRRKALLRESLQNELRAAQTGPDQQQKLIALAERLILLAA